jgi:hypothetical protein
MESSRAAAGGPGRDDISAADSCCCVAASAWLKMHSSWIDPDAVLRPARCAEDAQIVVFMFRDKFSIYTSNSQPSARHLEDWRTTQLIGFAFVHNSVQHNSW